MPELTFAETPREICFHADYILFHSNMHQIWDHLGDHTLELVRLKSSTHCIHGFFLLAANCLKYIINLKLLIHSFSDFFSLFICKSL